jgi:hypothetical protein
MCGVPNFSAEAWPGRRVPDDDQQEEEEQCSHRRQGRRPSCLFFQLILVHPCPHHNHHSFRRGFRGRAYFFFQRSASALLTYNGQSAAQAVPARCQVGGPAVYLGAGAQTRGRGILPRRVPAVRGSQAMRARRRLDRDAHAREDVQCAAQGGGAGRLRPHGCGDGGGDVSARWAAQGIGRASRVHVVVYV